MSPSRATTARTSAFDDQSVSSGASPRQLPGPAAAGLDFDPTVFDPVVLDPVVFDSMVYDLVFFDSMVFDPVVFDSMVFDQRP
jgi:hypothetical protein